MDYVAFIVAAVSTSAFVGSLVSLLKSYVTRRREIDRVLDIDFWVGEPAPDVAVRTGNAVNNALPANDAMLFNLEVRVQDGDEETAETIKKAISKIVGADVGVRSIRHG